ncbi:MAG: hypothetical protein VXZ58_08740, partial [Actinomycetota bacterium]|nr:hypothetical protein [Actinomycetota bacterium]
MIGMMVPPADEDNLAGEQWQELADGFNDLQTNLFQGAFKKQVPWKSEPYIPPLPKVVTSPSEKESETEADAEKPEEPPTVEPAPKVAASDPVPATKPEGLNTQRVVDKQPEPVETKETPEEESEKEESKKEPPLVKKEAPAPVPDPLPESKVEEPIVDQKLESLETKDNSEEESGKEPPLVKTEVPAPVPVSEPEKDKESPKLDSSPTKKEEPNDLSKKGLEDLKNEPKKVDEAVTAPPPDVKVGESRPEELVKGRPMVVNAKQGEPDAFPLKDIPISATREPSEAEVKKATEGVMKSFSTFASLLGESEDDDKKSPSLKKQEIVKVTTPSESKPNVRTPPKQEAPKLGNFFGGSNSVNLDIKSEDVPAPPNAQSTKKREAVPKSIQNKQFGGLLDFLKSDPNISPPTDQAPTMTAGMKDAMPSKSVTKPAVSEASVPVAKAPVA